jgi:hypothetical protein
MTVLGGKDIQEVLCRDVVADEFGRNGIGTAKRE